MEYFLDQLINALTLGSIYGLIAIGYTMVYGIIGMINFAHGEVYMIGAFTALILLTLIGLGNVPLPLMLLLVGLLGMAMVSVYGFAIERVAYRPLRGSFRLAPLITAIGMSLLLQSFVQVSQSPNTRSIPPLIRGGLYPALSFDAASPACATALTGESFSPTLPERETWIQGIAAEADLAGKTQMLTRLIKTYGEGLVMPRDCDVFTVYISWVGLLIILVTAVTLLGFWYLIARTPLGRAQRACEQDRKMASLVGVNVDRTISLTFVMGAALATLAGVMYLVRFGVVDFFIGFLVGIKAFTAAVLGGIGSLPGAVLGALVLAMIEVMWSAYVSTEYKDVAAFSILAIVLVFLPQGLLGRPEVEKV